MRNKLVILGVIVIVITFGGWYLLSNQAPETPIEQPQVPTPEEVLVPVIEDEMDSWKLYSYPSSESEILSTITFRYPPLLGNNPSISSRKTNPPQSISNDWGGFVEFSPTGKFADALRLEFRKKPNSEDSFESYVNKQAGTEWDDVKYFQASDFTVARMRFSSQTHYDADVAWYFIELPNNEILTISTSGDKALLYNDDTSGNSTRDKIISTLKLVQ